MFKTVFNLEFCNGIVWKNNKEKSSYEKVYILVNQKKKKNNNNNNFQIMKKEKLVVPFVYSWSRKRKQKIFHFWPHS